MNIRKAREKDLEQLNAMITDAVMQWDLPDRVKRLSLNSFHYDALDLQGMRIRVAIDEENRLVGVAALEATDNPHEMLLHGLFVSPERQRSGIGTTLLQTIEQDLRSLNILTLLVKPQRSALVFFQTMGFSRVKSSSERQYENLMCKAL